MLKVRHMVEGGVVWCGVPVVPDYCLVGMCMRV